MERPDEFSEPTDAPPLIRAIAGFREEIDRLIDEQKALILARKGDAKEVEGAAAPVAPRLAHAADAPGDPRQRLDALARRLDQRRKPTSNGSSGGDPR